MSLFEQNIQSTMNSGKDTAFLGPLEYLVCDQSSYFSQISGSSVSLGVSYDAVSRLEKLIR